MPNMNDDERKELKKYFDTFDKNGNGMLEFHEFANLTDVIGKEAFGPSLSEEEVRIAFNTVDEDGNGLIDFEEFLRWVGGL